MQTFLKLSWLTFVTPAGSSGMPIMWEMNEVSKIEYQDQYVYYVEFDDGTKGHVDFSPYLEKGPTFEAFRDLAFFRRARIEGGTIAWPNGADIAPETLYDKLAA